MQQITMGRVQFDEIEAHPCCAFCSPAKVLDKQSDAGLVKLLRNRVTFGIGKCRGGYNGPGVIAPGERLSAFPRPLAGSFAASMSQLDTKLGSRRRHTPCGIKRSLRRRCVGFRIESKAAVTDAATACDICHLDCHHTCARHGKIHPMLDVPIAGTAIISRILTHGRDRDTIWQIEGTELER